MRDGRVVSPATARGVYAQVQFNVETYEQMDLVRCFNPAAERRWLLEVLHMQQQMALFRGPPDYWLCLSRFPTSSWGPTECIELFRLMPKEINGFIVFPASDYRSTITTGRDYLWAQKINWKLWDVFMSFTPKNDKFKLYFWKILKMKNLSQIFRWFGRKYVTFSFNFSNILDLFFGVKDINTFQTVFHAQHFARSALLRRQRLRMQWWQGWNKRILVPCRWSSWVKVVPE